jgi:type II secretory pathway pseudopilin PulG
MSIEPTNDQNFVAPDTDDLDAFTSLLDGKAKELKVEDDEPQITNVEVDTDADDEDDTQVNDTTDDEAPDEDDDSEENSDDKPKKKANRYQERINELTAKAREAERALAALKAAQEQKQAEAPKPALPVVQDTGPDPDAKNEDGSDKYPLGEFDPQYIRDMARHTIDKEWTARKEQEAQEAAQRQEAAAREALQAQWVEKLTPMTEQHEDFIDKTMGLESAFDGLDPAYSDYLVTTIKSLDHGPEVLYYFANNLEEAKRFVQSGPLAATLALGEINAMFKGNTRKAEPKVSKAPPPPQVNKGSKTRTAINPDTDDLDAFSDIFFVKKGR